MKFTNFVENFYYTLLLNITIIIKSVFQYSLSVLKKNLWFTLYVYTINFFNTGNNYQNAA